MNPTLIELATEFQTSYNLDINTTTEAFAHDALHALLGLGASLEDEEVVLNVSNALVGEEINPKHQSRVDSLMIVLEATGFLFDIIEALSI